MDIYDHSSVVVFTNRENLRVTCGDLETLVIEIGNGKGKTVIANLVCRSPNGSVKTFHDYLELLFDRTTISNKNIVLVGDFLGFYHSNRVKI